ncbi:MAG: tRNA (adenosine(37)-N6)-threonylcarbamoyltransferase complex ATPase subunit type 1 TsaE [Candidatus Levybacteria bacterium]|nr:tRNA (adenosine(37)-N6)-threonylcarbamoyltransferase complex ATPase subunit type 1 TsaE [Candidatus Levybacteria bacterium]
MEEKEFITHSARETEDLGSKLAHNFETGDIILLHGELGAGKTTFVQGVAKAFNIKSRVISPTFILLRRHRGKFDRRKINLYHIDLYRLEGSEIKNIGLEDAFEDSNGIFLIEWGEKHEPLKASWEINFEILGKDRRRITIRNYSKEEVGS